MAKLLDQRGAIRLLKADGWVQSRGGKHVVKMVEPWWLGVVFKSEFYVNEVLPPIVDPGGVAHFG